MCTYVIHVLFGCNYSNDVCTVEYYYNEIAYSECLSIVKYFASPSKSCILLYTFNIVNIRYKELILVSFELHYNEIPLYICSCA